MRKKLKLNKSGAALAYVLGVSILLLILCSALMVVSRQNLVAWSRVTDSRQTFVDAGSAVEFAKSEMYSQASTSGSEIANGAPSYSFFVERNDNADFAITDTKPLEDKYAAKCILDLDKTEHILIRTTKVWVDGAPFTAEIAGKWTAADYEQTFKTLSPSLPPDPSTVSYKEFDPAWITTGEVVIQTSDDEFTRYTYKAKIDATVSYRNSKRVQNSSFSCEVVPGYAVKHTANPAKGESGTPTLSYWIATGENYGEIMLGDNAHFNSLPSAVPIFVGHDTTYLTKDVKSDYPIVYPARVHVPSGNRTITAPAVYFYGSTEVYTYGYSIYPSLCLEKNATLTLDADYVLFDRSILAHEGYEKVIFVPEKGRIVRFENINAKADGVNFITKGTTRPSGIAVGDYTFTDFAIQEYKAGNVIEATVINSNIWRQYFTKIDTVPTYITLRNQMIGLNTNFSGRDSIISSEVNVAIDKNPSGKILENRSNGCQWTYGGDVADYPRYSSDKDRYAKSFGPTYIRKKNAGDVPFKNELSLGKNVFSYISSVKNWQQVLPDRGIPDYSGYAAQYELEYKARNVYIQYDSADPFLVPDGMSVRFSFGGDGNGVSRFFYGASNNNVIKQEEQPSQLFISMYEGEEYEFVFPVDIKVELYNGVSYTIKAGTYKQVPLTTVSGGGDKQIDLFSTDAMEHFSKANPPGYTKPPAGTGGSGGGGTTPVDPPAGGEVPGVTNKNNLAEFKEGLYE